MSYHLDDALEIREVVRTLSVDIYAGLGESSEAVYTTAELEALLNHYLVGQVFAGPLRTRSKLAKQAVCLALGYPVPESFTRVKPRFPGQDLDVYVQQHDNLQIWNEALSPTRRYALIRVNDVDEVTSVRVVEGEYLAAFDKTGTLTSKYQAKRRGSSCGSELVSAVDTPEFVTEFAPTDNLSKSELAALSPVSLPVHGKVLTVRALHERLLALVGQELPYSPSERLRGEQLHRAACAALGLGSYADTGRFPDIVCQSLEVKLQTAGTIDLGLVMPDSEEPAITLSPVLRHRDARYLVAYAVLDDDFLRVEHVVTSTGADFFSEFRRFGGLVQNRKLQLRLPRDFFHAE